MKYLNLVVGLLICTGLAACVTVSPAMQMRFSEAVFDALIQSPESLHTAADAGDAHAQLSYALVLEYGLNGAQADAGQSGYYRRMALASRGSTTSAVYVPGYRKVPGHTQLLTLPRYEVTAVEAQAAENCAALLAEGVQGRDVTDQAASGVCGGIDNYHRLAGLWQRANQQG